jgi:hypothetical protein
MGIYKNMKKKKKNNIEFLLEEPLFYLEEKLANGGSLWGNSTLNADPYAPIGQMANMAGTMGAGILDNAIEDQHQRINVEKETGMGILKGAGQGAALGANPMLAAATGGLSIAAGAVIGGIGGGLISHKNAKKNAQANHDALIEQYYGDPNQTQSFADGGNLGGDPKKLASNQPTYNDSLALYNAYQFQKNNTPDESNKGLPKALWTKQKNKVGKESDEMWDKARLSKATETAEPNIKAYLEYEAYIKAHPKWYEELNSGKKFPENVKKGGDGPQGDFINADELDKYAKAAMKDDFSGKIARYYDSLTFDDTPKIGYHSSPDLLHPTIQPIASYHDGVAWSPIYKKPIGSNNPITTENRKPIIPTTPPFNPKTADKLESRSPNMLDNDLPIRDNNFQMDYSLPNMPKMDKFYVGMDDKNEALRQAGKPYKAKNAQGHILNIVSGDLNRNKPSEGVRDGGSQRIGYDRGNPQMYADGGLMQGNNQFSELNGYKHEQGGIPLAGAEVEGGEVKWNDYIFSDRLETEKGSTFASIAKRIKNKYKGRENDKLANDSMEIELTKLMKANESARLMKEEMNQASHLEDLKKYGGFVDLDGDGAIKYANGGRMEIARAARKAGLSPEKFAKHLINAKIKYADGGPFKFKYDNYDKAFPVDAGPFRGSIGNYGESADPFGNFQGDNAIDFTNLGNYPMLNSDNIPSYDKFVVGNLDPNVYNIDGTGKTKSSTPSNSYGNITNYETPKFDPFTKGSEDNYFNMGTMEKITPRSMAQTKTSDQLPQRPSYEPGSLDEFLNGYNNGSATTTNPNNQKGSNNFGYAEAGLVASNLAGVDNFIKSLKPAQTKFDRINLDELDLSEARLMNARNQAQGLRQSQGNIRNNASSSGQALSNLAANNAALTEQKMNADLSTYLQENQTNVGIRNQEKSANNQISREEYIANEQNRANAQSVGNIALANIGNNTQGYFRDKVMTKADDQQNARVQEVINSMGYNYRYGTDPATDKLFLEFISTNSANKTIGG